MAFAPPRPSKSPEVKRISVANWEAGTVTDRDDARTPIKGLKSSGNVLLEQDNVIRPRPSMTRYGQALPGIALGELFEVVQTSSATRTFWMIVMCNVNGTARPYISKDGGAWEATTGKTYSTTAEAHFCEVGNKVLIMNGEDHLSYLDTSTMGTTNVITPFTAISAPGAPTLTTNTGLTGTTFNIFYRISANSTVGETAASPALTVQVSKDRDFWLPTTENIKISWPAVTGAVTYNIYMSQVATGSTSGNEYLIASGINGLSYTDDGTASQDSTRLYPSTDSTAGPKASRGTVINGRVWLVGDPDVPFYVRRGGDYGFELDFSPANGGGYSVVGSGTKEVPVKVMPFRDGRGNSQITVLCQGTNGKGKRYILALSSLSVGGDSIPFWEVIEDNGQDGTDSPDGVILYNDSLWYPSRDGFKTTGTKPQIQNLLSTDRVSNTIQRDIKNLNNASMTKCVGIGYEGRLYWAVPNGSSTNNEVWVLDLDRKGAWMKPWNISADWMMLYNDNSGTTHFIFLSGNAIYELSYSQLTNDNGIAFPTSGNSGQIRFSEDGRIWARVLQVIFVLLRPQGSISFNVAGKTEDASLASVGVQSFTSESSVAGWSEPANGSGFIGWGMHAWSQIGNVPVAFSDSSVDVIIEVDEDLQWMQYGWNTTTGGVDYSLSDVIVEYIEIGIRDLS